MTATVGWDVGGAHLKAARAERGRISAVAQLPCALWQGLDRLLDGIPQLLRMVGEAERHSVTMTGELADSFATRHEGVQRLAASLADALSPAIVNLYAGARGLVPHGEAAAHATLIASANWHASASLVAAKLPEALLIDIGSTTTDIVPVSRHAVAAEAYTDADRLAAGELVYTGFTRTSLMAVAPRVPFRGRWAPLMNEYFASMADVYRILGKLDETADQHPAADGREKTLEGSCARLARMIGADAADGETDDWRLLAEWFAEAQLRNIEDAIRQVLSRGRPSREFVLVAAGVGDPVIRKLAMRLGVPAHSFSTLIDIAAEARCWADRCAPAVAIALIDDVPGTSR